MTRKGAFSTGSVQWVYGQVFRQNRAPSRWPGTGLFDGGDAGSRAPNTNSAIAFHRVQPAIANPGISPPARYYHH